MMNFYKYSQLRGTHKPKSQIHCLSLNS